MALESTPSLKPARPHGWHEWYEFARGELGYAHPESVEYANLRYVEERNREPGRNPEADRQ